MSGSRTTATMALHGPAVVRRRRTVRPVYAAACVFSALALVASGLSYFVLRGLNGMSNAFTGGPVTAQNILLMGLESRRDWNGNILPDRILAKLHAGSAQGVANGVGGNATNTLILIHIPAGGKKAVGFSIPRDDWVNFAGTVGPQQQGKIDQAYGVSMYYQQAKLRQQYPAMSQDQLAVLGNQAGRQAAVATVEQLTGVRINHFAAINLDGFYELAKVLGGVNVCLRHPVRDSYSGAHFPAGYQHLNAAQSLAFVRQRHGLANGDLDRTHRQQAFLDSVVHQLRTEGVLADLTKIRALLSVAHQYVITDPGWNLLQFAVRMRTLATGNITFRTLPIRGYAVIAGQDANVISPPHIKAIVHAAFYPSGPRRPGSQAAAAVKAGPPSAITVNVLNGGDTAGLARSVANILAGHGYRPGTVGNTSPRAATAVRYGAAAAGNARQIAAMFAATATADSSLGPHQVEILLGASATMPTVTSAGGGAAGHRLAPPDQAPVQGPQGGLVSATNGVPCVD